MKQLISVAFLLIGITTFGQETTSKKHTFTIPLAGKINLSEKQNTDVWKTKVLNLEMPAPGGKEYRSFLREQKLIQRERYPVKTRGEGEDSGSRESIEAPSTGKMFEGNTYQSGVPMDNTMAISNDGILLSAINSTIWMFDVNNDSLLYSGTLHHFIDFILGGLPSKYDPKIIYDPILDRFAVVFLYGTSPAISKIIVAFAQSSDPTGEWNVYQIPGNPLNNNRWTDYPSIALNAEDFFITGNMIIPNEPWQTGFDGSMIWQINKESGFNGDEELSLNLWTDITYNGGLIRNLNPVDGAMCFENNHHFFLSNRNFDLANDTVFLLEVTNTLSSGEAELIINAHASSDSYFLSPEARQAEGHTFDTNDSRVLGAVLFENSIQFVQNCLDTLTGVTGIYHGTISNLYESPEISGNIISFPAEDLDLGYPNISHIGETQVDENTLISFMHTGPTHFAGTSCIFFDKNSGNYSPRVVLKEGDNYVDILNGIYERWGDYSGSQPLYSLPGNVWIAGSFGTDNKRNGTWIAELTTNGSFVSTDAIVKPELNTVTYPNPASEFISVQLYMPEAMMATISLFDISGKLISVLYMDRIKKGENLLTFDVAHLKAGTYIIRITNTDNVFLSEKIIKK